MAAGPTRVVLPIIPLERDHVLLPGVTIGIPVRDRSDIAAILTDIYKNATSPRPDQDALVVGCVPLCSPLLSHEGQQLLEDSERRNKKIAEHLTKPGTGQGQGEEMKAEDFFHYGVAAKISRVVGRRPGELQLVVEGTRRFRIERFTQFKPYAQSEVTYLGEEVVDPADSEAQTLFQRLKGLSRELLTLVRLSSLLPRSQATLNPVLARRLELFIAKKDFSEAGILADFMVNVIDTSFEDKLRVLSALEVTPRLEIVVEILNKNINGIKGSVKITSFSSSGPPGIGLDLTKLPPDQRDALLRRRMAASFPPGTKPPPGGFDDGDKEKEPSEAEELQKKLDEAGLSPDAKKVADKELKRLSKMMPMQAEYGVLRTYLEALSEVPWSKATEDDLGRETLTRARKQLDDDHYGLEKIKKRLLEYLAVLKLKQTINKDLDAQIEKAVEEAKPKQEMGGKADTEREHRDGAHDAKVQILKSKRAIDKSPILLLVGPPGVGKTSLAKSVANALGRKFHRISLGGVRDEAEIRGHRRTYVAAMPGLIVKGLQKVGVNNPVFLLDEIDKIGTNNFHGDPSAAMLEVLDPEQNHTFTDHYLNIPLDLSKVLFIATANTLETIAPPLLDRMETIALSGYTTIEKRQIANRHLLPKQISANGLAAENLALSDAVLEAIITGWTRESGVRNLEREIGSVCRFKAVEYADAKDQDQDASSPAPSSSSALAAYTPTVSLPQLEEILGHTKFEEEVAATSAPPGVVTGLVAYSYGGQGSILFIEVADMPGVSGGGMVQTTGSLGDVLRESVAVALTWVKAHAYDLGLTDAPAVDLMRDRSIHVHCPSGAVPKDGPSAGLAHTVALVSLFSGKCVPPTLAMTGEVSLRGRVLPVGGIKEKLIGALRAGVKTVLLPAANTKDAKELPQEVRDGLEIVHVQHIWEALRRVWPDHEWPGAGWNGFESRL